MIMYTIGLLIYSITIVAFATLSLFLVYKVFAAAFAKGKSSRKELLKGTHIDPFSHPSYSADRRQELRSNNVSYDEAHAKLKEEYNIA